MFSLVLVSGAQGCRGESAMLCRGGGGRGEQQASVALFRDVFLQGTCSEVQRIVCGTWLFPFQPPLSVTLEDDRLVDPAVARVVGKHVA